MSDFVNDIRGVLIQVEGTRLLLPNATISEVLGYADPDPVAGAPDWLLGRIRWRGWQLPLVSFSRLAGVADVDVGGIGSKIVVLKSFGDDARLSHIALLTHGFPRLVTVSRDALVVDEADGTLPRGVRLRVRLNDDAAVIPDIAHLESALREALAA